MKNLKDILYEVKINQVVGNTDLDVNALYLSSLEVNANGVFIAVKGFSTDGHKYITSAIENGAVAIVCEDLPSEIDEKIVYVIVEDSSIALAVLANNFYDKKYIDDIAKDLLNSITFTIVSNDLFLPWATFKTGGYEYRKDRGYIFEKQFNELPVYGDSKICKHLVVNKTKLIGSEKLKQLLKQGIP